MGRDYFDLGDKKDFNLFLSEFQRESDRAAAVLAGSYLDSVLESLLRKSFIENFIQINKLFRGTGPLNSFSSKIMLTEAFGLISKDEASDLNKIRYIRNEFAHRAHGLSFTDQSIKDRCDSFICVKNKFEELPIVDREYPREPRMLFNLATTLLGFNITYQLRRLGRVQ